MATEQQVNSKEKNNNEDAEVKSDPGTTNTTDPQEHMEGPLSSLMHKTGESFEKSGSKASETEEKDK